MSDQDDELLEDYDDGSGDADQEAKIKAFQKKVKGLEKIILSPKQHSVEKRREAVQMLGELGEIESIESLVRVYQKDKSPGMKQAAAQALGMFKALESALFGNDPERQEQAQALIEGIVFRDAIGQKSRLKRFPLQILAGILSVSFVILGFLAFSSLPPAAESDATQVAVQTGPTDVPGVVNTPIPTPSDVPGVVALLLIDQAALSSDTSMLRGEMQKSMREESINCALTLRKPVEIVMPVEIGDPEVIAVAGTLNTARTSMIPVVEAYENACRTNQPIPRADANTYDGVLVSIQTSLFPLPSQLSSFGVTPVVPVVTAGPTMTPTPITPTVPPTAVPTVDAKKYSRHFIGLRQIVSDMTGGRGHNTLLRQYWDDIVQSGSTGGCRNLILPSIAEDYVLPEDLVADAPAELITAIDNINTGLNLSRQSWNAFSQFCSNPSLSAIATTQYTAADTAQTAFEEAEDLLNTAESKLKGVE